MKLKETDPELYEIFTQFSGDEVPNTPSASLPVNDRYLAILAVLIGCQGKDLFGKMIPEALENGLSPVQIREAVYQSVDYLGMGRACPFIKKMNKAFKKAGIVLPLPEQKTVNADNRLEKGVDLQAHIFGEQMREAWKSSDIGKWLGDNCFGDFYTRNGLSLSEREMITFCFLMGQGDTTPQMIGHAKGNFNMGNDEDFMIRVVDQCVPYIGYPRSLNAIAAIKKAAEEVKNT